MMNMPHTPTPADCERWVNLRISRELYQDLCDLAALETVTADHSDSADEMADAVLNAEIELARQIITSVVQAG